MKNIEEYSQHGMTAFDEMKLLEHIGVKPYGKCEQLDYSTIRNGYCVFLCFTVFLLC